MNSEKCILARWCTHVKWFNSETSRLQTSWTFSLNSDDYHLEFRSLELNYAKRGTATLTCLTFRLHLNHRWILNPIEKPFWWQMKITDSKAIPPTHLEIKYNYLYTSKILRKLYTFFFNLAIYNILQELFLVYCEGFLHTYLLSSIIIWGLPFPGTIL